MAVKADVHSHVQKAGGHKHLPFLKAVKLFPLQAGYPMPVDEVFWNSWLDFLGVVRVSNHKLTCFYTFQKSRGQCKKPLNTPKKLVGLHPCIRCGCSAPEVEKV